MSDNVVPFPTRQPPQEDPLYFVTVYPHGTIISQPDGECPDPQAAAEAIFDSTFHVMADAENAIALVCIGNARSVLFRQPNAFDTPAQRAWLARRLDDIYEDFTGHPRTESRASAFFKHFNPFRKGR